MIPVHPVATEDPQTVDWAIPGGLIDFVGTPATLPAPLEELVEDQVVESVTVGSARISITLTRGASWRTAGAAVRTALVTALEDPQQWTAPERATSPLAAALADVVAGEVGDYIRSHRGELTVVSVDGDCAEVSLTGACRGCPARDLTLHARIERAVRDRYPDLQDLRLVADQPEISYSGPWHGSGRRR